ncbi:hypothetical protein HOD29_04155 [archaeon]|jgi:hypothetical protein|nr:hypothetical protein [archaeon]
MDATIQSLSSEVNILREKLSELQEYIGYEDIPWEKRLLTAWERRELAEARRVPRSECIPHEEVKKLILAK